MAFASYLPLLSPGFVSLALLGLPTLPHICLGISGVSTLEDISELMSSLIPLGPPSQAWQSGEQEAGIPSLLLLFFISPWKVVPWVSDQRVASQLLWEPELNLKVKQVWPLGLGKKLHLFHAPHLTNFTFFLLSLSPLPFRPSSYRLWMESTKTSSTSRQKR